MERGDHKKELLPDSSMYKAELQNKTGSSIYRSKSEAIIIRHDTGTSAHVRD